MKWILINIYLKQLKKEIIINKIEIKYNNEISDEEIERLIEEGEKNEENDKKEIQQIK